MIACWLLWSAPSHAQDESCPLTGTEHSLGESYHLLVVACDEEDTDQATLEITNPRGLQTQTMTVDVTSPSAVALMDITGGPIREIYVPEASGNANTAFSLWAFDIGQERYVRILDSSGTELTRDASGLIINEARGSCCSWVYDFYRWISPDFRLAHIGQIEAVAQDIDEESGKAGSVICRVKFGTDPVTGTDRPSMVLVHHYCSESGEGFQLEWSSANF
jgi:hypothetical protein